MVPSTSTRPAPASPASVKVSQLPVEPVAPLENGDHLTRAEFQRRYDAMPEAKKAELIEGKVYMASPVGHSRHGRPHYRMIGWLNQYTAVTPGVDGGDNSSLRLDLENMPQPDAFLFILPEFGGQARIDEDDYIEGAPDLIVEIASSSASFDLHEKLRVYRRNGVRVYVVWRTRDEAIDWFVLRDTEYERREPDAEGLLRSDAFPGLWLDPAALLAGDMARVLVVSRQGLASPEHAAFVESLRVEATRRAEVAPPPQPQQPQGDRP